MADETSSSSIAAPAAALPRRAWPAALPRLSGTRRYVAGAVYLAVAALTLVVIAGTLWALLVDSFVNAPACSRFGFRTATTESGISVAGVSREADAAGLRTGDVIVAIGRTPVAAAATEFTVAETLAAVKTARVPLTVRAPGGNDRQVVLDARSAVWWHADPFSRLPLWLYALIVPFAQPMLILVAASLLLFVRRPQDPEAMLFALAFLLLNFTPDLLWWMDGLGVPSALLGHLSTLGWLCTFVAMAGFPDGRFVSRWARGAVLATIPLELASLATRIRFGSAVPAQAHAVLGACTVLVGLAAGVAVLVRYRAMAPGPQRQQIKWAVGGFGVSAVFMAAIGPFDPAIFLLSGNPFLFLFGQLGGTLMTGGFALGLLVSLLRYRLYDAEAALARSLAYGVLTIALVGVFAASEKVIEILGERALGPRLGAVAGVVGTALAAILVGPLHHRVGEWAERRFQRKLLHLRRDLPALMDELRETEGLDTLGAVVAERAGHGVRACRAAMVVDRCVRGVHGIEPAAVESWQAHWTPPADTGFESDRADPLLPVRIALATEDSRPIGWLLLGPRPDGSLYGRSERAALMDVAEPIARAIKTVERRLAREQRQEDRIGRLESSLAAALDALSGNLPPHSPAVA